MKKKIAILGAGMSALASAWEITNDPSWSDKYEITIYSLGWRVGGKTATGRGQFARIEEHGIHILQGWYENTFLLIQEVYAERAKRGLDPKSPFQGWRDGFVNDSATLLTEWIEGRGWVNWPVVFPTNEDTPGDGKPLTIWQLAKKGLGVFLETLLGSPYQTGQSEIVKWILSWFYPPTGNPAPLPPTGPRPPWWDEAVRRGAALASTSANADPRLPDDVKAAFYARDLIDRLDAPPGTNELAGKHPSEIFTGVLEGVLDFLEKILTVARSDVLTIQDRIRRSLTLIDLGKTCFVGLLTLWDWKTLKFDFRQINGQDFRGWITVLGARPVTVSSAIVRFLYTGTFANLTDGVEGGQLAAGSALHFFLQSAGYKGSFVWKFKAGTGDTMVMPFYQVLTARGVRFELFREITRVGQSRTGEIEEIDVGEQVTLQTPGVYDPTIPSPQNVTAWPSEPNYQYIDPKQAAELRERRVDLEEPWANWTNPCTRTLRKGADFDAVVLAIPVAALKACCSEIIAGDPRWKAMVENVQTTQTQSMQLWLNKSLSELGMNLCDWGMATDCAPNTASYANPIYSWIDMSLVLPYEQWPAGHQPKLCIYYTGPLADAFHVPGRDAHWFPAQQHGRVMETAHQWLWDHMGYFWPNGTAFEAPQGLDFANLEDGAGGKPMARWRAQYFRANVAPWQRFSLAVPGTETSRMKTNATGFANLFLAGDWIDYGMNVGYIEGAITSGMLAADAVVKWLGGDGTRPPCAPPDLAR